MKESGSGKWRKIFTGIFRSTCNGFPPFSLASLTELCSIWYGFKSLMKKLLLTIQTDDVTSSTRGMDLHGWLWAVGSSEANGLN